MSVLGFAYFNNGTDYRYSYGNDLVGGEVWFQYQPDTIQLAAAFPAYTTSIGPVLGLPNPMVAAITATAAKVSILPTALPKTILAFPTTNPGVTGAPFIASNTLFVSQGLTGAAVQIGTTGPTGSVVI